MYALLFAAIALFPAVLIHELGHAIACRLVGFQIDTFAVWPFRWKRVNGEWQFAYGPWPRRGLRGFVEFRSLTSGRLRRRGFLVIAAGPALSFFAGVVFVLAPPLLAAAPPFAAYIWAIGLWSLFLTFNLIPLKIGNGRSDGFRLLELALRKKAGLRRIAIHSLLASYDELRPRQWDRGLVALALDESIRPSSSSAPELLLHYIRYQWYADTGDTDRAGRALDWILGQRLTVSEQLTWRWETVWFQAFSRKNAENARAQRLLAEALSQAGKQGSVVWKAEAAIAACECRHADARVAVENALSCMASEKCLPTALARALESDLLSLLDAREDAGRF